MNVTESSLYSDISSSAPQVVSSWVRVWSELPPPGVIVPVWDGDYIYYASYWDKEHKQFWIVSDSISPVIESVGLMKCAGEQVFPLHWMKISPPSKGL